MRAFRVSVRHTVSRESRVIRFLVMSVHGRCLLSVWCVSCQPRRCEAEDGTTDYSSQPVTRCTSPVAGRSWKAASSKLESSARPAHGPAVRYGGTAYRTSEYELCTQPYSLV